ncbi:MAG: tetratricopeptide repeat protein [Propionivibrio sp.]
MKSLQDHILEIRLHLYSGAYVAAQSSGDRAGEGSVFSAPASLSAGIDLFQQGRLEEAIAQLIDFLETDPENQLAYVYLGFACAAWGQEEDARLFVAHAEEISPLLPAYHAGLGESFLKGGNCVAALHYLRMAIAKQPDLFAAYPALAEAMRQNGQAKEAIQLLESAASMPSESQDTILGVLVEWLTHAGDVTSIAKRCTRIHNNPAYHALGLALAPRTTLTPAYLAELVRAFLNSPPIPSLPAQPGVPLTIAFLLSDCRRESSRIRLESLLLNLPPARFKTVVLWNDARREDEFIQRSGLMSDSVSMIGGEGDSAVLEEIARMNVQVLVELDGLAVQQRLSLFLAAPVPVKLSWSDTALPLLAGIPCLHGEALWPEPDAEQLPGLHLLPGLGEYLDFPSFAIEPREANRPFTFACLCSPLHYDEESWRLFAHLLEQLPTSRLLINLGELGADAQRFISEFFQTDGNDSTRLDFIHATTPETIAAAWNQADVGFAPLHGPGDMALPLGLWMEKPYLALDGDAPWSRRPGAMLRALGQGGYVADTPEAWLRLGQRAVLAPDGTRIAGLRQTMAEQGFVGDAEGFARAFAELIEQLHQRAC